MSPAVRFLALVVAGWTGVRIFAPDVFDFEPFADRSAPDERIIAKTEPDPVPTEPAAPEAEKLALLPQAPTGDNVPASPWPAGAIMTPYGLLLPYGAARPEGAAAMPQWAMPMAMAVPQYAAPSPRRPVVDVPRYRYVTVDVPVPNYVPQAMPAAASRGELIGYSIDTGKAVYAPTATGRDAPRTATAARAVPPLVVTAPPSTTAQPVLDRWQASAWSFLREALSSDGGTPGLAPGSTLGGDQTGVRLLYNHTPNWGLSARYTNASGSVRGDELALGVRYRPDPSLPLAFTVERRQAIGDGPAARSAFAAYAEAGIYGQPLGAGFDLSAYAQAGAVGIDSPDLFIDGAATATRQIVGELSAGAGVWGAAQPGASRLDVGPRLSLPLFERLRLSADYRQRVAGDAAPDSGAAVTVSADF